MLVVSGRYQDCQNGSVSNQLADIGGGRDHGESESLMCDRVGTLYSVHALSNSVSKINLPPPKMGGINTNASLFYLRYSLHVTLHAALEYFRFIK
jgi:hypothetical protein